MTSEEARAIVKALVQQEKEKEMFTAEHIIPDGYLTSYEGKVVIIKPTWFKPEYRRRENQLFLAECGFGCDPEKIGTAVYGRFLIDGEATRIERYDIIGAIAEEYIPEWAQEALKKYRK